MTTRRELLRRGAAALVPLVLGRGTVAAVVPGTKRVPHRSAPRVAVVGAGAFGGWTALNLAQHGASVTLIDPWGAGNVRSSSGGETRVIRAAYNGQREYIEMARRALDLWREHEAAWQRPLLRRSGVLWMFENEDDAFVRRSADLMRALNLTAEELSLGDVAKRFPQIRAAGLQRVWWESEAGYLLAREACDLVRAACERAGVEYVTAHARPGAMANQRLSHVVLSDAARREADVFVFACGPWLGALVPYILGWRIRATRQYVLYFGTPAGDRRFDVGPMPAWVNFGERLIYGIPGNERRGFKIADDTSGAEVDPTSFERTLGPQSVVIARALLRRRFPALARSPLVHAEVCQYESTPDGHYLMDWHPEARNLLLLGGGSGHGFKMGPAIGEVAARLVLGEGEVVPLFAYERLKHIKPATRPVRRRT
ncbi:MAG: FAD-dependent oxidoreductase [Gemmatimonadaceae bacterium]